MAGGASGALINKAALSSTPPQVLNWYLYFCAAVIATSGELHGYNSSNMSGILKMNDFKHSFHLGTYSTTALANLTGWVTSVIVIGGLIGALISAPLNDRLGRKWSLFIMAVLYLVGCIIQITTTDNINQVIGARALEGFAGGAATVTGTMYLAEIAPKAVRGLLGALFSTNIMLGVALGYWGNYGAILNISPDSHWQWRVPLLIQFIPGIIIVAFLPFVVESPRWLAMHGHDATALKQLLRLRKLPEDHDYLIQEWTDILDGVEAERGASVTWVGLAKELGHDRSLLRRFILVMVIQIGFNLSGGNSITYYQTSILTSVGITGDNAYLFSGVYGLIKVLSVFIYALFFAERYGRRKTILIGAVGNIACVTWIAIFLGAASLQGNKAGGWVSVAAICLFAVFYGIGYAPNAFGINGEVFPSRFRAKVMSLCIGMQYLANFLLVKFFPNMVAGIGADGPFIIFACTSTVIVLYLFLALPETKGVAIEHMSGLFRGHWWSNGLRGSLLNKAIRGDEAASAASIQDVKPAGAGEHLEVAHAQTYKV